MDLSGISKAIGAVQGGVIAGGAITAMVAAAVGSMPPAVAASVPWWGYLAIWAFATVVAAGSGFASTYLAPANIPAVGDKVTATTPANVVAAPKFNPAADPPGM